MAFFTKLALKHCWEETRGLLDFGDLDLIFKVASPINIANTISSDRINRFLPNLHRNSYSLFTQVILTTTAKQPAC